MWTLSVKNCYHTNMNMKITKEEINESLKNLLLFPQRLKELRTQNNLSQTSLAKVLEISRQSYNAFESGKCYPSYENLLKLSYIFDVSIDYLLGKNII